MASPLEISISVPNNGQNLSGTVLVDVTASGQPLRVEFFLDNVLRATDTALPYQWQWDTRSAADGSHIIRAEAVYRKRRSKAQVAVTVNNSASAPTLPAFGIAAGADLQGWTLANLERQLNDYANIHATWIRHDFSWDVIEPQKGQFNWAGYDVLVREARERNLGVIATVTYTPAWANGGHSDHNYEPTSASEFGRFAGDVASRYASQGVHTYEIWNEPNIGFWKPVTNPTKYTAVLTAAYQAIHAADPQAVVVTGGTSPAGDGPTTLSPQTWLTRLYDNGAGPHFDAVGHHPYVDAWSNWEAMADYSGGNLRQIMTAHGDSAKRIYATEVGCNPGSVSDCSARLATAFAKWKSYSWAGVLAWFIYWDPNVYGLVDGNWNPRPLWYAYQQAAA